MMLFTGLCIAYVFVALFTAAASNELQPRNPFSSAFEHFITLIIVGAFWPVYVTLWAGAKFARWLVR